MSNGLDRRGLLRKTMQIGLFTAVSRVMGIARSFLQLEYLGFTGMSDAFLVAYRIPNFLRKIFAEGALSAAFVPVFVRLTKQDDKAAAYSLMSYAFVVFQGLLFALTIFAWWQPMMMIRFIAPGFAQSQMVAGMSLVRIVFPFILCVSSAALLGGALQAVNCFSVGAFGPVLLNIVYLIGLLICRAYGLTPIALAWFIVGGGVLHLLMHYYFYRRFGFEFGCLTDRAWPLLKEVLGNFGPALLGMSVIELNMVVDTMFGSYLPAGSITMLHYGNRFMGIPLGIFGVAFATVLLSHFSRTSLYARSRFGYYLLEAAQLIIWLMLPAMLLLWHVAFPLFGWFLAGKAPAADIVTAGMVLSVYGAGLIFFCLNKVAMSMAYACGDRRIPAIATVGSVLLNIMGNTIAVSYGSRTGIALSTVLSAGLFFCVCTLWLLSSRHGVKLYVGRLMGRVPRIALHGIAVVFAYYYVERVACGVILPLLNNYFSPLAAYWVVATPLLVAAAAVLYHTRRWWGVRLYFAQ